VIGKVPRKKEPDGKEKEKGSKNERIRTRGKQKNEGSTHEETKEEVALKSEKWLLKNYKQRRELWQKKRGEKKKRRNKGKNKEKSYPGKTSRVRLNQGKPGKGTGRQESSNLQEAN